MEKKQKFLIDLKEGQRATIISISGGRGAAQRLADLGLTPETKIKVISAAPFAGPVEIEVRGSKLALGQGIASKIIVEPI